MSKSIKLDRKSVRGNRVFKVLSLEGSQPRVGFKKLGTLEYKRTNEKQVFINVNQFFYDFLKGSNVSSKFLNTLKHVGLLKSPWAVK